jgi:hypothetical protein
VAHHIIRRAASTADSAPHDDRSGVPLQRPAPPNVSAVSPGHRPTFVGDCSGFQRIIWDNVSSDVFVSMVKVRRVVHGAYSFLRALPSTDSDDGLSIHTRPGKIPTITHASKLAGDDRGVVVLSLLTRVEIRHMRIAQAGNGCIASIGAAAATSRMVFRSGYMAIAHEEPPVKSAVIRRPIRREWVVIGPLDLQDAAGD